MNYMGTYYATNGEKLAEVLKNSNLSFNINEVKDQASFNFRFVPLKVVEKYIKDIAV